MEGADTQNDEAVATFSAITGADAQTAEHTLEAFAWDLNRGVNFFLENGARMPLPSRPALDDDEPVLLGEEAAPSWRRGGDSGASEERAAPACERGGAPLVAARVLLCLELSHAAPSSSFVVLFVHAVATGDSLATRVSQAEVVLHRVGRALTARLSR